MNQEQLYREITKELGIDTLPPEEQDKALAEVLDAIVQQAIIITHSTLPEDKKAEFVALIEEGGDAEKLIEMFSGTIEGKAILDKAVQEVVEALQ